MPQPQRSRFTVTSEAQLGALLDVRHGTHLLAQFLTARTASQAARELSEPANRVSSHVRRLHRLGLLVGAGAQGRRQLYRAVAQDFYLSPELQRSLEGVGRVRPYLAALVEAYLAAGERRTEPTNSPFLQLSHDGREEPGATLSVVGPEPDPAVAFAARLNMRVLHLNPARYRELTALLWQAVQDAEPAPPGSPGTRLCTLALLTFPGSVLPLPDDH